MHVAAVDHTLTERWSKVIFRHLHNPIERLIATVLISLAEPHGQIRVSLQRLAYLCQQTATFTCLITPARVRSALGCLQSSGFLDGATGGLIELADPAVGFPTPTPVHSPRPGSYARSVTAATFARVRGCRLHAFDSGWWVKTGDSVRWTCKACR